MAKYTLRDLLQRIEEHGGPHGLELEGADLAELADLGRELGGLEWVEDSPDEGTPFSLNIPLQGATALHMSIGLGTIDLVGEARDDVLLRGVPAAREELEIEHIDGAISIRQKDLGLDGIWPTRRHRLRRLNLELALPLALQRLEIKTGLGSIVGRRIAASVHLNTGKGNISLHDSRLQGTVGSGLGDVDLAAVRGELRVHTGSGDVTVQQPEQARLSIETGRGNVCCKGGSLQSLQVHTGLGDVSSACALAPGKYQIDTGTGAITLELAEGQAAQVEASTGMGKVASDWPLVRVGRPGPAAVGSMRMVGSIGAESRRALISLKAGMGDIRIKRRTAGAAPAAEPAPEAAPAASGPSARLAILESLARGEITVEDAEELLKHLA